MDLGLWLRCCMRVQRHSTVPLGLTLTLGPGTIVKAESKDRAILNVQGLLLS